jgi:hypothetical protein
MLMRDDIFAASRWRGRLLTTGHLPSRHPVVVGTGRVVGGCGDGAGGVGGGSRARPAAGRVALRGGPAPALDPFPVPGPRSLFSLLRVACHCWGLTRGCLRASSGGHPHAVAASRGRPPVDVRRLLCAGFRQCGLFAEVRCGLCLVNGGVAGTGEGRRRMPRGRWRPALGGRPRRRPPRRRASPAPFFLANCGGLSVGWVSCWT